MAEVEYTTEQLREIASKESFQPGQGQYVHPNLRDRGGAPLVTGYMPPQVTITENSVQVPGRAYDKSYDGLLTSIRRRHDATGVNPATILNFLPIPLVTNSAMAALKVRVEPAPRKGSTEYPFSCHVWYDHAFEVMQRGDRESRMPWDHPPIDLAKAFLDEYKDFGGVVIFQGLPEPEYLESKKVRELITGALAQKRIWQLDRVDKANGEWRTANNVGAKNIVEADRLCAQDLLDEGVIDRLPEWMTERRELQDIMPACGQCQSRPAIGALKCVVCGWILDPAKAFLDNVIDEESSALERLTRQEVISLGVSAFVAETIDEKPARLAKGLPRPMSIAQERAFRAEATRMQQMGNDEPSAV